MGADVTVAARKESDIAILRGLGYGAEDIKKLHYGLMRYRVIFNTVPQPILTSAQTAHCRENCLLVELAVSVVLILTVNLSAAFHFDRKGKHRKKRRR